MPNRQIVEHFQNQDESRRMDFENRANSSRQLRDSKPEFDDAHRTYA